MTRSGGALASGSSGPESGGLRIATRESPLALWQAEHVRALLQARHPGLCIEMVPMTTQGDQLLSGPLFSAAPGAGGKGLFVKELEQALLEERADLAVHSMKDVPAELPDGLILSAFLASEDPRDALVSSQHASLDALPPGARVGTASLRRQSQLLHRRPDLRVTPLRGNVGTRLRKLEDGEFDAILLAHAGLLRLGLASRIRESLDAQQFVPAIGQGIIGLECRTADARTRALLAPLDSAASRMRLEAERAVNRRLGAACQSPVAAHARLREGRLLLDALVAAPDGQRLLRVHHQAPPQDAETLGLAAAEDLLRRGAAEILQGLMTAA